MCNMAVSNRQWLPLEIEHKGEMHAMSKLIQATQNQDFAKRQSLVIREIAETQGEVDCFA